jgi:phosphoribosylformylglycinamidine synthase
LAGVATVVVDVMLKPEILDPQGQAVLGAVQQLGETAGAAAITGIRIGKHIELTLDGDIDEAELERVRALAETLLSNPVIEDFAVRIAAPAS